MHLVQLLLPLYTRGGRRIPKARFEELATELTHRHGGLTAYVRTPATGLWRPRGGSGRVHRDEVVIYEVMVNTLEPGWWASLRRRLERQFDQDEIVVRAQRIRML